MYNYEPRDGLIPSIKSVIRVHHPWLEDGIVGTVEGITAGTKYPEILLKEADGQVYKYSMLSVSWEYV